MATGLFHRAIAQSGVISIPRLIDLDPWLKAQVCVSFMLLPYPQPILEPPKWGRSLVQGSRLAERDPLG